MEKLLVSIVAIFMAGTLANASTASLGLSQEPLVQQARVYFEGAKNGLILLGRKDQIVSQWYRAGHMHCRPRHGGHSGMRMCRWIPPAIIEKHRLMRLYQIVDREAFVEHKTSQGRLLGTLAGLAGGFLTVLMSFFGLPGSLLVSLGLSVGIAALGYFLGGRLAGKKAQSCPEKFTKVTHYTVEKELPAKS